MSSRSLYHRTALPLLPPVLFSCALALSYSVGAVLYTLRLEPVDVGDFLRYAWCLTTNNNNGVWVSKTGSVTPQPGILPRSCLFIQTTARTSIQQRCQVWHGPWCDINFNMWYSFTDSVFKDKVFVISFMRVRRTMAGTPIQQRCQSSTWTLMWYVSQYVIST